MYLLNFVSGSFSFYREILLLLRDTKEFILAIEPQRECSLKVHVNVAISIKWYMLYIVLRFSTWKKIHPTCKESFWFRFVIPFSDCLLSYGKPVAGCMWRCAAASTLVVKNKSIFLLWEVNFISCKFFEKKFYCIDPSNMTVLSRGCKPRIMW